MSEGTLPVRAADVKQGNAVPRPKGKPLEKWQGDFVEWLAHQPVKPPGSEQLAKAEELAQRTIKPRSLKSLKSRPVFREQFEKLQERALMRSRAREQDAVKRARAKVEQQIDQTIDLRDKAVKELHYLMDEGTPEERQAVLRIAPKYIDPTLERIWPKRDDSGIATSITIHLTAKQEKAFLIPEGEFEVLDAEMVDDPEFDDG